MFYARSRKSVLSRPSESILTPTAGEYWAQKAYGKSDNRGKLLRRDGFTLAEDRYGQSALDTYHVPVHS